MNKMQIGSTITNLISRLTPQLARELTDTILDTVENMVNRTRNPFDNMLIMPLVKISRRIMNIEE